MSKVVFVSAPYVWRDAPLVRRVVDGIREGGAEVLASWLDETDPVTISTKKVPVSERRVFADLALREIRKATDVVLVAPHIDDETSAWSMRLLMRGGRHFEAGYALALGKRLWLVGFPHEHIFQALIPVDRVFCGRYERMLDAEACVAAVLATAGV